MSLTTLNHQTSPLIALNDSVHQASYQVLQRHGFSLFSHSRYYPDHTVTILNNQTNFTADWLESNLPFTSYYQSEIHSLCTSYIVFGDEVLGDTNLVTWLREKHGFYHFTAWIKRYKDYYETFSFAMAGPRLSPCSYYLNHMHELEEFTQQFSHHKSALINTAIKHKLHLPAHRQDPNVNDICFSNTSKRHLVQGKDEETYLTHQEFCVLSLLKERASYKVIARELEISPATVGTYLNNIKLRTNLQTRSELLALLPL